MNHDIGIFPLPASDLRLAPQMPLFMGGERPRCPGGAQYNPSIAASFAIAAYHHHVPLRTFDVVAAMPQVRSPTLDQFHRSSSLVHPVIFTLDLKALVRAAG